MRRVRRYLLAVSSRPSPRASGRRLAGTMHSTPARDRCKLALVALAFMAVCVTMPTRAAAASYTLDCPPTDDACLALAERLEAVVSELETQTGILGDASPTSVDGTVALSQGDRDRFDLMWWGQWAVVGLTLALLFAGKWHGSWRFMRE